jgi:hypothetical protein
MLSSQRVLDAENPDEARPPQSQRIDGHLAAGLLLLFAVLNGLSSTARAQAGFPFERESLHYTLKWPSGLSLGDANLTAYPLNDGWSLEMTLDARIPGYSVIDQFRSISNQEQCSQKFERNTVHGTRKTTETTTFVSKDGLARRITGKGGGSTEFPVPGCARDALAFIYYARREMGQGKLTPPQSVYFGSAYSIRMDYTGAQVITAAQKTSLTDHVIVDWKGPVSSAKFEMFFARDPARTPLLIRVPSSVGTVSMELAPR